MYALRSSCIDTFQQQNKFVSTKEMMDRSLTIRWTSHRRAYMPPLKTTTSFHRQPGSVINDRVLNLVFIRFVLDLANWATCFDVSGVHLQTRTT
jgi:hypothetical protein